MSGSDFTLTPNYGFKKPVVGSDFDLWGGHVNEDLDSIDSLIFSLNGGLVAPSASPAYGRNGSTWLPVLALAGGVMGGAVALAGISTAPLAAPGTNTAQIASTAFVAAGLALYLPLVGGNLSGPLGLPSGGSATAPTLWFGNTNNGIFSNAGTTLQFSANGAVRWTVGGTVLTATVPIRGAAGSAAAPTFSFAGDTATGFYQPSVNTIALSVGGNDVATATAGKAVSFQGAVTLAQDATLALQAVTLRQMQAATTGAYLPLVGGSITGTPGSLAVGSTLPADAAAGDLLAGIASPTGIAFNAYSTPTPAWKTRAAGYSAMETFDAPSGTLAWWIAPSVAAGATANPVTQMTLNSGNLSVVGTVQSSNGRIQAYKSGAGQNPSVSAWSGGDNFAVGFWAYPSTMWFGQVDGTGLPTAGWMGLAANSLNVTPRIYANGGIAFGPNNSWEWVSYIDGSGNQITNHRSGWYDYWDTSNGNRVWCGPNGNLLLLDGNGTGTFKGDVSAANLWSSNVVQGYYLHSTGDVRADAYLWAANVSASTNVNAGSGVIAPTIVGTGNIFGVSVYCGGNGDGSYGMFQDSNLRYFQFASNWYWGWFKSNGDLIWHRNGAQFWIMRAGDGWTYNNIGPVAGVGAYVNISDRRLKENIAPFHAGLPEILKINPIIFTRLGKTQVEAGFEAQDVQASVPLAVRPFGIKLPDGSGGIDSDNPTLGVEDTPLIAALVNAVKTLNARIAALEAKA